MTIATVVVNAPSLMRPPGRRGGLYGLIILAGFIAGTRLDAAEVVWSIEKLNASQSNWGQLVGASLRVEGRVSSQIKGQIRFQKCDLNFRLDSDRDRKLNGAKNLEVLGSLQRDGGKFSFVVNDLKSMPTDLEHFHARESSLRNPLANDLYELGDWAVNRGTYYEDQELIDRGKSAETRALALELRELPKDDYRTRMQLADKAVRLKLSKPLIEELQHEGFRVWLTQNLKNSPLDDAELAALETAVKSTFPEALLPLKAWPTDLTRSYVLDPLETYRTADANQRLILHRLLGADVQWPRIVRDAAADGSNGAVIADRIDLVVPERHAVAEQYRDRELQYRLQHIDAAPRAAALELAAAFRQRRRNELAAEALLKWLVAKERRTRPEEAPQFIDLADDYLTLLRDEPKAVALLTEAHRREPQSADVLQRFESLGYEYDGFRWKKRGTQEPSPMPIATPTTGSPTSLEIGMTALQLDQFLGRPAVVTVIRSASSIDEVRVYGRLGEGTRTVVQLRRGPGDPQPVVTRFDSR